MPPRAPGSEIPKPGRLEALRRRLAKRRQGGPVAFDPEGSGYDIATAIESGAEPDAQGHLPSIDPRTGMVLKGRKYPTWDKTIEAEAARGSIVVKGPDGRYYTQPAVDRSVRPAEPTLPPALAAILPDLDPAKAAEFQAAVEQIQIRQPPPSREELGAAFERARAQPRAPVGEPGPTERRARDLEANLARLRERETVPVDRFAAPSNLARQGPEAAKAVGRTALQFATGAATGAVTLGESAVMLGHQVGALEPKATPAERAAIAAVPKPEVGESRRKLEEAVPAPGNRVEVLARVLGRLGFEVGLYTLAGHAAGPAQTRYGAVVRNLVTGAPIDVGISLVRPEESSAGGFAEMTGSERLRRISEDPFKRVAFEVGLGGIPSSILEAALFRPPGFSAAERAAATTEALGVLETLRREERALPETLASGTQEQALRQRIAPTTGAAWGAENGQPFETVRLSRPLAEHTTAELADLEGRITANRARYDQIRRSGQEFVGNLDAADYDWQVLQDEKARRAALGPTSVAAQRSAGDELRTTPLDVRARSPELSARVEAARRLLPARATALARPIAGAAVGTAAGLATPSEGIDNLPKPAVVVVAALAGAGLASALRQARLGNRVGALGDLRGTWYSRLAIRIREAPFEKGTPEQWLAQVSKGVSKDELDYTGIRELLEDAKRPGSEVTTLTRTDLHRLAQERLYPLGEVELREQDDSYATMELQALTESDDEYFYDRQRDFEASFGGDADYGRRDLDRLWENVTERGADIEEVLNDFMNDVLDRWRDAGNASEHDVAMWWDEMTVVERRATLREAWGTRVKITEAKDSFENLPRHVRHDVMERYAAQHPTVSIGDEPHIIDYQATVDMIREVQAERVSREAMADLARDLTLTPQYESWARKETPGGHDYTELLLTLDPARLYRYESLVDPRARDLEVADYGVPTVFQGTGPMAEPVAVGHTRHQAEARALAYFDEIGLRLGGGHWSGVESVLASVLHKTHNAVLDPNGLPQKARVLFVSEMQSDWAQAGRKHGFIDAAKRERFLERWTKFTGASDRWSWGDISHRSLAQVDDIATRAMARRGAPWAQPGALIHLDAPSAGMLEFFDTATRFGQSGEATYHRLTSGAEGPPHPEAVVREVTERGDLEVEFPATGERAVLPPMSFIESRTPSPEATEWAALRQMFLDLPLTSRAVIAAPYSTTPQWAELVWKRMLVQAVEDQADYLAISNGTQVSRRYNQQILDNVDRVSWNLREPSAEGAARVELSFYNQRGNVRRLSEIGYKNVYELDELDEVIPRTGAKLIAEGVRAGQSGGAVSAHAMLGLAEGVDDVVAAGDMGHFKLYDEILPKALREAVKKLKVKDAPFERIKLPDFGAEHMRFESRGLPETEQVARARIAERREALLARWRESEHSQAFLQTWVPDYEALVRGEGPAYAGFRVPTLIEVLTREHERVTNALNEMPFVEQPAEHLRYQPGYDERVEAGQAAAQERARLDEQRVDLLDLVTLVSESEGLRQFERLLEDAEGNIEDALVRLSPGRVDEVVRALGGTRQAVRYRVTNQSQFALRITDDIRKAVAAGQDLGAADLRLLGTMASGAVGATTGLAADDENRLRGFFAGLGIGVAAGAGLPLAVARARRLGEVNALKLGRVVPPSLVGRTVADHMDVLRRLGRADAAANLARFTEGSKAQTIAFRGDNNGMRIGNRLLKNRLRESHAFYFTEDPDVAAGYAKGKSENLAGEMSYEDWYEIKLPGGGTANLDRAWYALPAEQKSRLVDTLLRAHVPEEGPNRIAFGEIGESVIGGADGWKFYVDEARGNWLRAAKEIWLNGATLFDVEEMFGEILARAGIPFKYLDPRLEAPAITPVFLSVKNPIDAYKPQADVIAAVREALKTARHPRRPTYGIFQAARHDFRMWATVFLSNIEEGDALWTTALPERAVKLFQSLGYDGIRDVGGKFGGPRSREWIVFEPGQVKSAIGNSGEYAAPFSLIDARPRRRQVASAAPVATRDQREALQSELLRLPEPPEGIAAAEEAWAGGVANLGDATAGQAVQGMPGYFDYRSKLEDAARRTVGDRFTVWRAATQEQLDDWANGADIGPVGVTLERRFADNWHRLAANRGRNLKVVEFEATPNDIVMRGKPEEAELVIDANNISWHQVRGVGERGAITPGMATQIAGAGLGATGAALAQPEGEEGFDITDLALPLAALGIGGLVAPGIARRVRGRAGRAAPEAGEIVLKGRRPGTHARPAGEIRGDYRVQYRFFDLPSEGERKLLDEVNALKASGKMAPKKVVTFDDMQEVATELGFEEIERAHVNRDMDGTTLLALRNVYKSNNAQVVTAFERLRDIQAGKVALSPEAAAHEMGQLATSIDRLERENRALLRMFTPQASEFGRNLNSLKALAKDTTDPFTWHVKAQQVAGRELLDEERLAITHLVNTGNRVALVNLLRDLAPKTKTLSLEALVTLRRAGLLTGLRTQARNFLSNTAEHFMRQVDNAPAVLVDRLAGLLVAKASAGRIAKQQTRAFGNPLARMAASARGAKRGVENIKLVMRGDLDPGQLRKLDMRREVNFQNRFLDSYVKFMFRAQGAADQPFRQAAFMESLYEQAHVLTEGIPDKAARRIAVQEILSKPSDDMVLQAIADSEEAVFQNANVAGGLIEGAKGRLRQLAAQKGLIASGAELSLRAFEWFVPFSQTPGAILGRLLERTPLGLVSSVAGLRQLALLASKGDVDLAVLRQMQREIATRAGRSVTGTLAMLLGAELARRGLMAGPWPDDAAERQQWTQQGKSADAIMLGGKWRRLTGISPLGNLVALGAQFYLNANNPEYDVAETIGAQFTGAGRTLLEQSFLRGTQEFIESLQNVQGQGRKVVESAAGSLVPTLVGDFARALDPVVRDPETVADAVKARIPGLSFTVPARLDELGRVRTYEEDLKDRLLLMVDPFLSRTPEAQRDPIMAELDRTATAISRLARDKDETVEAYRERKIETGNHTEVALVAAFADPQYERMAPEDQAEVIRGVVRAVRSAVARSKPAEGRPARPLPPDWTVTVQRVIYGVLRGSMLDEADLTAPPSRLDALRERLQPATPREP